MKPLKKLVDLEIDYREQDIWSFPRLIGDKSFLYRDSTTLDFTRISQYWLREALKRFIKYTLATKPLSTAKARLLGIQRFSTFLRDKYFSLKPVEIDRALVLDFITFLKLNYAPATCSSNLSHLKIFFEMCVSEEWLDIQTKPLIYKEDFLKVPKTKPRFIPEETLNQLNKHLDTIPLQIRRMVLLLQECGMRISELVNLPFDCLLQDNQGDYFLRYPQYKMKKEHNIPISKEVALAIQNQQEDVRKQFGNKSYYLFLKRIKTGRLGKFSPDCLPITPDGMRKHLHKLSQAIYESTGVSCNLQPHQFRHTVGTSMINNGVPQHIVQLFLGHESPEMTSVYAHIFDQTLKEEFTKFKDKMVDTFGNFVSGESVVAEIVKGVDPDSIDAQWLKKNIRAQALPNGLCGLPASQPVCPYGANKCLTGADGKGCHHFKTDIRYLDKHQDHLARTTEVVEWAEENRGAKRAEEILKLNLPIKQNLESIINTLKTI